MVRLDKKQLRIELLKKRKSIDPQWRKLASEEIIKKLMPYVQDEQCIGIYVSDAYEVNTHELIRELLKHHVVCCPLVSGEGVMEFRQITDFSDLKEQHYKILEPTTPHRIEANQIDVMIIPLVGFNCSLERIGQGKGFYDRYLKGYQRKRIALAYAFQESDFVADPHDERIDMIINEIDIKES